jgi:hypothetical protein
MAKPPSITELGCDLIAAIRSSPADAAALDAMVRGRARLYAAATEALIVIRAVAARPAAPSSALAAPAVEVVQRHAEKIAGVRVPEAEIVAAVQTVGSWAGWLSITSGIVVAVFGPIYGAVLLGSEEGALSTWGVPLVLMGVIVITNLAMGAGLIAYGCRLQKWEAPEVRRRTDVHTLVRVALDAGRRLGSRAPGVGPHSIFRHLSEGMALWMVHSVALERAAAGDNMHQDAWSVWHGFPTKLAMAVWIVATAAGERPPVIALDELVQGPFNKSSLDQGKLYAILGAFDAAKDSLYFDRVALRTDTVPQVMGAGMVALSGGLDGIRGLMEGGELSLLRASRD